MISTQSGSLRLCRFAGIQVYLHWSWFALAIVAISRREIYQSRLWNAAEFLALFAIVLMHEFGHSLATRQTGGKAEEIILWPFGGIAFVNAPPRPGAQLWSVAAGPLVNVVLVPVIYWTTIALDGAGWNPTPDLWRFLHEVWRINVGLLVFNLLPLYPLDGGQLVRSVLWYFCGPARSLQIATIVGLAGLAALLGYALWAEEFWLGFLVLLLGRQCVRGFQHAKASLAFERLPRHPGFACPACGAPPPSAPLWLCAACGHRFDPFATGGACPHCRTAPALIPCAQCGGQDSFGSWSAGRSGPGAEAPVIDV